MNKIKISITLLLFSCSSEKSKEDIFNEYVEAHNSHNLNKTMGYYDKDASFEVPGQDTLFGIDRIIALEQWDEALNSNLEVSSFVENGDTLIVNSIIERNDWFRNLGIDSIVYNPGTTIIFENGKIKSVTPSPLIQDSRQSIMNKLQMFMNWAKIVHPDVLQTLLPNGKFVYNKESAIQWVALIKEWKSWAH